MALMTLRSIEVSYGAQHVLDKVDLQIERGERVCLVGRNGAGKSTLMKIICGEASPDRGEMTREQGARVARLAQEVPEDITGTVFDVVSGGLGDIVRLLAEYHRVSAGLEDGNEAALSELERIHHNLEAAGGWQVNQRIETVITRLKLPADAGFPELSGGLKRRVMLAKALVSSPDLLLLDEPTNHLDLESIGWLEEFLLGLDSALLFVTHDRMLLQKLATRIVELDRGRLKSWPGDYNTYLERRNALAAAEAREQALFDKKLAQEEIWVRQGVKARRTRNEGRVRALEEMRKARRERRESAGSVEMQAQEAQISGRLVIRAEGISFSYGAHPVVSGFSTTVLRGDKIGVIGPNGSGKTTLLRLLLGELAPQKGVIRLGTRLEISYFDQLRAQLDENRTVAENIAEGNDTVIINGKARHVIGYLQEFLFSPERARTPVKVLSGGERNRLLLARLFTRPSNVLVLDEPTNDLDSDTLDLLEELLLDYQGTVLLVSHDRAFLNNIVTSTIVFEGGGTVSEYVGGYDDWLRQRGASSADTRKKSPKTEKPRTVRQAKLGYKEQRELETLPFLIEALEAEQQALYRSMSDPLFYQKSKEDAATAKDRVSSIDKELAGAFERWAALEELKGQGG